MTARSFFEDLDDTSVQETKKRSFFDDLDDTSSEPSEAPLFSRDRPDRHQVIPKAPMLQEKGIQRSFFEDIGEPLPEVSDNASESDDMPAKEGLSARFGRSLAMTAQSTNAVTPQGAKIVAEQVPASLLEGATSGFYQAPKSEEPGEQVIQGASRLTGELSLIHGAYRFLNSLGVNPHNWYQRIGMGATVGAGLSAAKQAAYTGEIDPQTVATDAVLWASMDAGLELFHGVQDFRNAVDFISKTTGKEKADVLSFLKDRLMSRLRGKPHPEPEVLGKEALEVAEEAVNEAKTAEPTAETIPTPQDHDVDIQSRVISETEAPEETLSLRERLQDYENRFINQYAPLDRLADGSEAFENPGQLAELVEGAAGQAKQALEHGQFDIETLETTGPGLCQIFEPRLIAELEGKKKLDRKAFRAYLAARSSLDRAKLGQKTAISIPEAQEYLRRHARYEPLAKEYTKFLNQNLTNLRKAGMLTEASERAMREMYLNYAPLHRLVERPRSASGRGRSLQPQHPVKKAKGSRRPILDPLESAVKNTAATYRALAKNRVMNAIRDRLEPMGYRAQPAVTPILSPEHLGELMGEPGEELNHKIAKQLSQIKGVLDPASYNPGDGKIFGYRNGERWEMEAPQDVIDAVKGLNPAQSSFVLSFLNKWRNVFSGGVVLQPGTMTRLAGMDLVVSTLQSKYPTFPVLDLPLNVFYHFPKMLFEVIGNGSLYQDYLKSGAAQFALQGLNREQVDSMVTSITNSEALESYGIWDLAKDTLKLPWTATKLAWKGLANISEKLSDATRLIEFKKSYDSALNRGLKRSQALTQAAHDAFEVSVPYGRQGNSAAFQEMYKIVPFMRTIVNSGMTFAEAMNPRNPNFKGMLATALTALTLPTLYFYMRNRNDERYQRIPQEERDKNIYIYNTEDPNEEPIKLRKLWQYGFVFQTLPERVVEFLAEKDPKAFEKLAKNFEYEFSPFTMLSISAALEDGFHPDKVFEGHRFSIIPEKQRKIDASLQHTSSTTETAKKLGALANVSPIYVDFMIGQTGGGLGKDLARLFDEAMYFTGAAQEHRPEAKKADNVLWETFFGRGPARSSEHLNRFYRLHDKIQMTKATIKQFEKEGKFEEASKYVKAHPFVETDWMRARLGTYFKKIDELLAQPVHNDEERRKKRSELDRLYVDMAKQAQSYTMTVEKDLHF